MSILVSNAIDSSGEVCEGGCESWIIHWENAVDRAVERCSVLGCNEDYDLVGAHVYIEDDSLEDVEKCYIIPLCKAHNHHTVDLFEVRDNTMFVPDISLDTCSYNDEEEE
jgi:hypothetical protein